MNKALIKVYKGCTAPVKIQSFKKKYLVIANLLYFLFILSRKVFNCFTIQEFRIENLKKKIMFINLTNSLMNQFIYCVCIKLQKL